MYSKYYDELKKICEEKSLDYNKMIRRLSDIQLIASFFDNLEKEDKLKLAILYDSYLNDFNNNLINNNIVKAVNCHAILLNNNIKVSKISLWYEIIFVMYKQNKTYDEALNIAINNMYNNSSLYYTRFKDLSDKSPTNNK